MSGDTWLLLWTEGARAFRVLKLADAVAANRRAFIEGDGASLWMPIACGTEAEVSALADPLQHTMAARCSETRPANSNTGHGHVFARPDSVKARCGGPGLCPACSAEAARAAGGAGR